MLLGLNRKCITVHCSPTIRNVMGNDSLKLLFFHWNQICFKLRSNIRFWNPIKFQVIEAAMKTTFGQMSDRIMHRYISNEKQRENENTCAFDSQIDHGMRPFRFAWKDNDIVWHLSRLLWVFSTLHCWISGLYTPFLLCEWVRACACVCVSSVQCTEAENKQNNCCMSFDFVEMNSKG